MVSNVRCLTTGRYWLGLVFVWGGGMCCVFDRMLGMVTYKRFDVLLGFV
ncbi:hypothetical protein [Candidatus Hodgkinia cicadicola]